MRQIVTHFTDNDLYTFTVMYFILKNFPRAEVEYTFFDRGKRKYPKGFGKVLQEQIDGMRNVVITEQEIEFMKKTCYFLPEWFFTFLMGYRFNPAEVTINQSEEGYLSISVRGKWYSTVMWEMPILSTISELVNTFEGNIEKYNEELEYQKSYSKMVKLLESGISVSDMGTRRRFSFHHHENVIKSFVQACEDNPVSYGKFVGTSNVWFAMKYNLKPIGTMSHQIVSFCENIASVHEVNYYVMKLWADTYDGDLGIYLYDCFGDEVFFGNLSKKMAMLFDGLRVDSGDEREQLEKIIEKYKSLGIDPRTKSVIFSNALSVDKAIELNEYVAGRMKDSYGIGTHFCADIDGVGYSNIVIKLTKMRITELREWLDCIKLSCDKGKTLGDPVKCNKVLTEIEKHYGRKSNQAA